MASVAVISSAQATINCFKGQFRSLPDGADQLLVVLNDVKKSLIAADGKNPKVERQIVHLSYDIVDAVLSKKPTKKLQELKRRLDVLHDKLRDKKPAAFSSILDRFLISNRVHTSNLRIKQTASKVNAESEEKEEEENPGAYVDILEWVQGKSSPVLFIVGKSGIESACTRKLCDELRNDSCFELCVWVSIDHNLTLRRVLQILLRKLTPRQDLDVGEINEIKLIDQISRALSDRNYLLVLDGVRTPSDWENIRLALPISGSTRVIITSSCTKFASLDNAYKISSMNLDGIRELLQNEGSFKPGLEKYADTIFGASGGSPVLATILGKSLQSRENPEEQQHLVNELKSYKPPRGESKVLAACYKWLAPELKPCLLYLSQFWRGREIEVESLYLLLAAQNLVFPPEGSQVCLDSLIKHLEELANRNLVEVHEDIRSRRGYNKSYRLQLQVQEFCISKATEEKFLQIVDMGNPKTTIVENYTRRLVVHLSNKEANMSIQFESQVILKEILSLLIFDTSESAEEKSKLPKEIHDLKEFIHLRILKFDGVNFGVRNVPKGINTLVLLRYLSFRGCRLEELPSSLSKLQHLETLDLVVQADCKMLIPNNVLTNMKRMLHLYFPRLYKRSDDKTKIQLQNLENLEILVNFDATVCDAKVLSKFKKLRILSTLSNGEPRNLNDITSFIDTRADLLEYSSLDIRSFDCYDKKRVQALKKLLHCKFVHSIHIEGQIGKLPEEDDRGRRISDIVLDNSQIEADPMEYLGMFENLQSLVLKNDAFVENEIVIAATKPLFCNLRSLKLQNLKYLKKLTIEKGAMPKISSLEIDSCASLQELSMPKELHDRLEKAQWDNKGDAYYIMPLPHKFEMTK